jgi:hypothetical protein
MLPQGTTHNTEQKTNATETVARSLPFEPLRYAHRLGTSH